MTATAVVTVVHGRHDHLARQLQALALGSRLPDLHVVVALDDDRVRSVPGVLSEHVLVLDGPTDARGLPLAAGRNLGFTAAIEAGCDVVIGLDVDCMAGSDLVAGYTEAVRAQPEVVWSGPVTYLAPAGDAGYPVDDLVPLDAPHPARPAPAPGELVTGADPDLFWSLSFALAAPAWSRSGGFDEVYVGYGAEDTDFARRVRRAGLDLGWVGTARAYHQHHPTSSPPREHLADILRNAEAFHARWGSYPMQGWLAAFEELGMIRHAGGRWIRS